jgi:type II secretory pathway pseudopilin PulG
MNNPSLKRFGCRGSLQAFTLEQRERASAFTLLELLVVITIIIILVSFLFPAFRGIQDQAKRTQAKNDLNQIVTAVNAFYTEYGKYPVLDTTTADTTATYYTNNNVLFDILRYDITRDATTKVTTLNPRQVVFIEPPIAKDQTTPKLGIRTNTGVWYDPWGIAYHVTIDANYNAVTHANPPNYTDLSATYTPATDTSGDNGVRTGAIAWTYGADGTIGNNNDGNYKDPTSGIQSDDVVSWQ